MENSESQDYYIAAGFREDCSKLVKQFEENDSNSFKDFCEIWKKMKFLLVYWSRMSELEMLGFCEEALDIAKDFISPSCNKFQRLAGIFLLYGLFFKAPIRGAKIRLTMTEWDNLIKLRDDLFKEKNFDAVFILNKLIEKNAFVFCVREHERGLENYYVLKDFMKGNTQTEPSQRKDDELTSILAEISDLSKSYIQTKTELSENSSAVVPKLYNGLEIERLLSTMGHVDSQEVKKNIRRRNMNRSSMIDSSSSSQSDDNDNFDCDMT